MCVRFCYCHIAPHSGDDRRTFFYFFLLFGGKCARSGEQRNEVDERKKTINNFWGSKAGSRMKCASVVALVVRRRQSVFVLLWPTSPRLIRRNYCTRMCECAHWLTGDLRDSLSLFRTPGKATSTRRHHPNDTRTHTFFVSRKNVAAAAKANGKWQIKVKIINANS